MKEIIMVDAELGEISLTKSKGKTINRRRMNKLKKQIKKVNKKLK